MNKKVLFPALLVAGLLVSCNNNPRGESTDPAVNEPQKEEKGLGLLFSESLGYNTKDAAVIEEEGERYIVYVSNETSKGKQVFAARKGTKDGNKWVYGEKKIVFSGNESSWDKNIYNPAIIKGNFTLSGTTYKYLMAYNGNKYSSNIDNHIGIAVSNDILGTWTRVGNTPIIENPEIYESTYGFGCPSIVSYDNAGKVYMFYSVGETETSYGAVTSFDFSNLNDIKQGGYFSIPVKGFFDNQDVNIYTNGGAALSQDGETLYLVKDRLPNSSNRPGSSKAVSVYKTAMSNLGSHLLEWDFVRNITQEDTIDFDNIDSYGWDEIYSGEFVTDGYGRLLSDEKAEVVYSTFSEEGNDINYSSTLCSIEVNL